MRATEYRDPRGVEVFVGSFVELVERGGFARRAYTGRVTGLREPDADVGDYGRSYGIPPRVDVWFFDGIDDSYLGDADYHTEAVTFGDVRVVEWVPRALRVWWALRRLLASA